jgi:hypothetical protein
LWYSLRVFPWSHLGSDVFDALVKEVLRRAVSYVWDRREVATIFLKKIFAVLHGLYRKAFVFVSSVRFTSAQKKESQLYRKTSLAIAFCPFTLMCHPAAILSSPRISIAYS